MLSWSVEQQEVFNFIKNDKKNAVITAVAGSGKSTTIIEGLKYIESDKDVLFTAFNKSIAEELKRKIDSGENVRVMTVHGVGYEGMVKEFNSKVDNKKYRRLLDDILYSKIKNDPKLVEKYKFTDELKKIYLKFLSQLPTNDGFDILTFKKNIRSLVDLGRLSMVDVEDYVIGKKMLTELSERHELICLDNEQTFAWYLLRIGNTIKDVVDFIDMIYLPILYDLDINQYDYVFIDECQDLSKCQRLLLMKSVKSDGRFFAVGDPQQSIYGFAGADISSYEKLVSQPNTIELPLSVTYRCAKPIVDMVKHIQPNIKEHHKNKTGFIYDNFSYKDLQSGDMVLCRQNFPLVSLCLRLIKDNIKAYINGSDIGKSLSDMIRNTKKEEFDYDMEFVFSELYKEREVIIERLMKKDHITYEEASEDSIVATFEEKIQVIEAISGQETNPEQVISKINMIFNKSDEGIMLSNIHKAKGLEADRVFMIHSDLLPSKYAKTPSQIEQETNLEYVAITRAKTTFGYIRDFNAWTGHKSKKDEIVIQKSEFLGSVGEKIKFDVKVIAIREINGKFGKTTVYEMKDNNGNIVTTFSDRIDRDFIKSRNERIADVGTELSFYATVSKHNIFNGTKSTVVKKLTKY